MPTFYTSEQLTSEEQTAAIRVWNKITTNTVAQFIREKNTDDSFPFATCSQYFLSLFLSRLYDIHPHIVDIANKLSDEERENSIPALSAILNSLESHGSSSSHDLQWISQLELFARRYNAIGIKTIEYRILADCYLHALHRCCGEEFTPIAEIGWKKLLSRMLDVVIPIVTRFELENLEFMENRRGMRFSDRTVILSGDTEDQEEENDNENEAAH